MNSSREIIIETIIFIIISLIAYLYVRKNNPDNVIERYYNTKSKILYNLFKISSLIVKITLFFNIKFLIILMIKSYFF
jgi:amino acid permease